METLQAGNQPKTFHVPRHLLMGIHKEEVWDRVEAFPSIQQKLNHVSETFKQTSHELF